MPKLTEEKVISIAKQVIDEKRIKYDVDEGLKAWYNGVEEIDGQDISLWTVSYLTPKNIFEQKDHFILLNDDTGDYLYIIRPGGRII